MDVETQKDQAKPRRSILSFASLIISLLALLMASIAVLNFGSEILRSLHTAKPEQQDASGIPAEINQLQSRLDQLQIQQTQVQQTLTMTTKNLSAVMLDKSNHNHAWQLDNIAHLLRLAHYQLHFSHNPTRALEVLRLVAQDSNKLNDPTLHSWQQELNKVLEQLKAIPKINANQLLSQLETLKAQIPSLPLKNTASRIEASTAQQQKPTWRQALEESWGNIKNLVVIRRTDEPIKPLLAPGQRVFLEQNLRLSLQQAEWGVMDTNALLYRQGIKQVAEDIKLYFESTAASTQNFLQTLQQLSVINVEPAVPNLAPLITQFQQTVANETADKPQSPSE